MVDLLIALSVIWLLLALPGFSFLISSHTIRGVALHPKWNYFNSKQNQLLKSNNGSELGEMD